MESRSLSLFLIDQEQLIKLCETLEKELGRHYEVFSDLEPQNMDSFAQYKSHLITYMGKSIEFK